MKTALITKEQALKEKKIRILYTSVFQQHLTYIQNSLRKYFVGFEKSCTFANSIYAKKWPKIDDSVAQ